MREKEFNDLKLIKERLQKREYLARYCEEYNDVAFWNMCLSAIPMFLEGRKVTSKQFADLFYSSKGKYEFFLKELKEEIREALRNEYALD